MSRYRTTARELLLIAAATLLTLALVVAVFVLASSRASADVLPSGTPTGTVLGGDPLAPSHPPTTLGTGSPTSHATATPSFTATGKGPVLSPSTAKPSDRHTAARLPAELAHTGGVPWTLVWIAALLTCAGVLIIVWTHLRKGEHR